MKHIKNHFFFVILFALAHTVVHGQDKTPENVSITKKMAKGSKKCLQSGAIKTSVKERDMTSQYIGPVETITDEQREYLNKVFSAVLTIIEGKSTPEKEVAILGKGEFFWPKDPRKPTESILYYKSENFLVKYVDLTIERANKQSPWTTARFSITPQRFPAKVFVNNFDCSSLKGYTFEKSFAEVSEHQIVKSVHVFEHTKKIGNETLRIRLETRSDVSNLNDKWPSSVYAVLLSKS